MRAAARLSIDSIPTPRSSSALTRARGGKRIVHTQPTGFLPVKVDGRRTYFEWISAGKYETGSERGTMTLVTEGLFRVLHFGFDGERLLIRIDTATHADDDLAGVELLRLRFHEPDGYEVRVTGLNVRQPRGRLFHDDKPCPKAKVDVAAGPIFELSARLSDLALQPDGFSVRAGVVISDVAQVIPVVRQRLLRDDLDLRVTELRHAVTFISQTRLSCTAAPP